MGYLIGAFGKLMAGKRVRSLQYRMVRVQSQLRRATREAADMEKYFDKMARNLKSQVSLFASAAMSSFQNSYMANMYKEFGISGPEGFSSLTDAKRSEFFNFVNAFSTENTTRQQQLQALLQMENSMMEQNIEMMKEQQLQPLKDLEEELQLEKDSLESQIQIANADYEAQKEMEKAGAKNLTPQYTGQG